MKSILLTLCFLVFGMNIGTAGNSTKLEHKKNESVLKAVSVNLEVTLIAVNYTFKASALSVENQKTFTFKSFPVKQKSIVFIAPEDAGWFFKSNKYTITKRSNYPGAVKLKKYNLQTC